MVNNFTARHAHKKIITSYRERIIPRPTLALITLVRTAMGENDFARFSEAVAFGENIAKGETDLGAFLTCETLFATRGSFRWYICNHSWMSKEPAARNAAGQAGGAPPQEARFRCHPAPPAPARKRVQHMASAVDSNTSSQNIALGCTSPPAARRALLALQYCFRANPRL
jgi:hypothetical protein